MKPLDHARIASILGSTFEPCRGGRPGFGPMGQQKLIDQYVEVKSKRPKYRVLTWDANKQKFTPQIGVRSGPYTLFGLRKALRKLRDLGYSIDRQGAVSVLVERI